MYLPLIYMQENIKPLEDIVEQLQVLRQTSQHNISGM